MTNVTQIVIIAILVEAIWENIKMIWQAGKFSIDMLGSLIISVLICVVAKVCIFTLVGIELSVPFVGYICTGIIVSRGANFINDLFTKLKGGN